MRHTASLCIAALLGLAVLTAGCENCNQALGTGEETQTAASSQKVHATAMTDDGTCTVSGSEVSSALALPTGNRNTSVLLVRKVGPNQIMAGKEFSYHIEVTNLTAMGLDNVRVHEQLPQGFDLKSTSKDVDRDGRDLTWQIGALAANQTRKLKVTGISSGTGDLTSCANAEWQQQGLCLTMSAVKPQLNLTLSGPDNSLLCDPLVYTAIVKNTGSGTACDVVVVSDYPQGVSDLDGQTSRRIQIGDLAPGASRKITLRARADKTGTYSHNIMAKSAEGLEETSSSVDTQVRTPILVVRQNAPNKRYVGRPIEYTISITNEGDAAAENTRLVQDLPSGVEFISASDNGKHSAGTISWEVGTLGVDKSREYTVRVRAVDQGALKARVMASAYCADDKAASDTVQVEGIPAILLEMVDVSDPIEVGANEIYEIRVTNQGSRTDNNIRITAEIPEQQKYVSAEGPTKASVDGQSVKFAPLGSLKPKDTATFRIIVKGQETGDVRFKVTLTSDATRAPVEETESTHIYE
jgi:uncharacterized repeat protein (TIGR01451 family)